MATTSTAATSMAHSEEQLRPSAASKMLQMSLEALGCALMTALTPLLLIAAIALGVFKSCIAWARTELALKA
ncbi:hypothetical protein HYH03_015351 [Edaphochlamys debaryana]|uniref:Uncharacterized protein n=1 Tax=Edaphochlamys debaryana TaxID=47281 RepID=A0A836BR99_9CHLO|nr:hypothetical protein HYH03_015351 [Edaphochlamys debaryana]|eukprot:KAG2485907.1 hypothetical protein HYH03_015351 [Edaphochlamys debaryana]